MTVEELRNRRRARVQKKEHEGSRFWLWLIPVAVLFAAAYLLTPAISRALEGMQNPPLRPDVVHLALLSNSQSDTMLRPKSDVAKELDALVSEERDRLGAMRTRIVRFASVPQEIYNGPNDQERIQGVLDRDYLKAAPDPVPGTRAAKALTYGLDGLAPDALVVVTIGTDCWEDIAEMRALLQAETQRGRRMLVLAHGIPTHNVVAAKRVQDLRGLVHSSLRGMGDNAHVAGTADFADAMERWLPQRLRALAVKMTY